MSRAQLTSTVEQNTGGAVAPFVAGKNKIINGDFGINQRNTTSSTSSGTYLVDRFPLYSATGTVTGSVQAFTAGAAPVAGYEATQYMRVVTTGQSGATAEADLVQRVEDVRTFAGQTVTLSFWARAASGTPKIAPTLYQAFGSGGSSTVINAMPQVTLSTSWARYSVSIALPSLTGKTIGTSSFVQVTLWMSAGTNYNSDTGSLGIQSNTFDIWGVQLESGSVATPFTTATGTVQGELAACQRYYFRSNSATNNNAFLAPLGNAASSTVWTCVYTLPVTMRTTPNSLDYSGMAYYDGSNVVAISTLTLNQTNQNTPYLYGTAASGLTAFRGYYLFANASLTAYLGFSAEL